MGVITGFVFQKGAYNEINDSVKTALRKIKNYSSSSNDLIISNTASSQEIVLFDNTLSSFKTIDLLDKEEKDQIKTDNNYKANIKEVEDQQEEENKVEKK